MYKTTRELLRDSGWRLQLPSKSHVDVGRAMMETRDHEIGIRHLALEEGRKDEDCEQVTQYRGKTLCSTN